MKTWQFTTRWLLGSQFAARLLGLLNNVLLARLLAPAPFGDYTQAITVAGSLTPVADMGVSAVVTRYVARRPHAPAVLSAAIALRVVQSLLLWSVALVVVWWMPGMRRLMLAMALAGACWAVRLAAHLLTGVARARVQAHIEGQAVLLERSLTVLLAVLGAVILGVTGALVGVLVAGVIWLLYLRRRLVLPAGRVRWLAWKRLLAIGAPLAAGDICHGLIMRLDIIAIGMRYGAQSVGWYASVSMLLWAGMLVPGSMALAMVPALAQQQKSAPALDSRVLRWMLSIALLMAVVLSVGAKQWVGLLYGSAYAPSAEVLRVLAWAFLPASVVAWGNAVLLVRHRTVWVATVAAGGLLCLTLCLWWWLPAYGLLGAAFAQVTAQCVMAVWIWYLVAWRSRERSE